MTRTDLDEFVELYRPDNRAAREETWPEDNRESRWRRYPLETLLARDKVNLDIFWLRDESLADSANLPAPGVIASELLEDLQAALAQFEEIAEELGEEGYKDRPVLPLSTISKKN